jgi:nitrate reductase beta subunit
VISSQALSLSSQRRPTTVEAQDGEVPRRVETKPTKGSNETHDNGEETHKGWRRQIANKEQNHKSAKNKKKQKKKKTKKKKEERKKEISYRVDELRGEGGFCARSKMGVVRD